jgi:ATP-binding cassette, subfamily B, bacterial
MRSIAQWLRLKLGTRKSNTEDVTTARRVNNAPHAGNNEGVAAKSRDAHLLHIYEVIRFAFPHRHAIGIIVALALSVAALNAIEPLVIKSVFDELTGLQRVDILIAVIALLAGFAIAREFMDGVANWLTWRTRIGLQYAVLEAAVGKLHKMPLRMQRSEGVGAIMTRLDRSLQGFTAAVSSILFNVLPSLIFLIIAIVIMAGLDWRLALIVLIFAPVPAILAIHAGPEQANRERSLLTRWSHIYSRFNEVLSGIVLVRSFTMEEAEKARFLQDVSAANQVVIHGVATDTRYGALSNLFIAVARLWVIGFGAFLVLRGQITIGTVMAFLGYVSGLFTPVQGLSATYSSLRRGKVSLDEILAILNIPDELGDSPEASEVTQVKGEIQFEDVHFRYEEKGRPLIAGVTFRVEPGRTLAIVGPSGSGKTTLMALLMRFYDPQQGRITLDERDLRSITQSSLRKNIGVVLQDPLLFNDTISANIAYGRPDATLSEIMAAARAAHADTFIERFPAGYDTLVGERGGLLSIGERQRITIARALLKDPRILVLDEATSALDAESEEAVQAALKALITNRTTFVIAHRLITVVNADQIIVLKEGKIIESGTHSQLWRRGGYYASLVRRQSHGLIANDQEGFEEPELPLWAPEYEEDNHNSPTSS